MKLKNFLISLLVVGSTAVVAEEVQVAQVTFTDQMINQANTFVERTVNIIARSESTRLNSSHRL